MHSNFNHIWSHKYVGPRYCRLRNGLDWNGACEVDSERKAKGRQEMSLQIVFCLFLHADPDTGE